MKVTENSINKKPIKTRKPRSDSLAGKKQNIVKLQEFIKPNISEFINNLSFDCDEHKNGFYVLLACRIVSDWTLAEITEIKIIARYRLNSERLQRHLLKETIEAAHMDILSKLEAVIKHKCNSLGIFAQVRDQRTTRAELQAVNKTAQIPTSNLFYGG